jgi:hypothetical protein
VIFGIMPTGLETKVRPVMQPEDFRHDDLFAQIHLTSLIDAAPNLGGKPATLTG